jgi:hypothetical protein
MGFAPELPRKRLAAQIATLGLLLAPTVTAVVHASESVEAQFRGCDTAGWCRFRVDPSPPGEETLIRVRPDGVSGFEGIGAATRRDRLNALLASMIHQHKQIRLESLRTLSDGTFAAAVIVNGADVAADPQLSPPSR